MNRILEASLAARIAAIIAYTVAIFAPVAIAGLIGSLIAWCLAILAYAAAAWIWQIRQGEHMLVPALALGVIAVGMCIIVFTIPQLGAATPPGWAPRDGCAHKVQRGDTLAKIGARYQVKVGEIVAVNPHVTNPNRIFAGDLLDICGQPAHDADPYLVPAAEAVAVTVPERAKTWAADVAITAPEWATGDDIMFLTAVAGPESTWCANVTNRGDANPPKWGPSVGCVQIRTLARQRDIAKEPWRDRAWLESAQRNVANAAWQVFKTQGPRAWGPARPAKGIGIKLPYGGPDQCARAASHNQCLNWWATAEAALANFYDTGIKDAD